MLVAALAVLVSGCGVASRAQDAGDGTATGTGANPPKGPVGPIPAGLEKFYQQQPDWQRCGSNQQCATITVPLDYTKPTGQTIELRARKVLARDRAGKIGTLFINPGGPGASGEKFAASAGFVLGSSLLRKFDVIGWDPRGVGQSTPVRCLDTAQMDKFIATDGSPDNEAEITDLNNEAKILADGCEQRSGELLPHVSTKDAARDIDVLRGIVGDPELYYLGFSYGTYLGATYAELFPKNVGRLVLDGAVDPSKTAKQNNIAQAKGFDTALDAFAEDCAQRSCRLGSSKAEVLAKIDKLINDSDATPLPGDGKREVTQALVLLGVLSPLYLKQLWPQLEDAVLDGLAGNGARLLALADQYTDREPSGYSDNANEAIYRGQLPGSPGHHLGRGGQGGDAGVRGGLAAVRELAALGLAAVRELAGEGRGQAAHDQGGRREADHGRRHHPRPRDAVRVGRRARAPAGERRADHPRRRRPHRLQAGQSVRGQRRGELPAARYGADRRHQVLAGA